MRIIKNHKALYYAYNLNISDYPYHIFFWSGIDTYTQKDFERAVADEGLTGADREEFLTSSEIYPVYVSEKK